MFFLDSNLWVYLLGKEDEEKYLNIKSLIEKLDIIVSTQIIGETSAVLKKKFGFNEDEIKAVADFFYEGFEVISLDAQKFQAMFMKASDLRTQYQFPYWDSLLISTALLSGCNTFFSEDGHDGLIVEGSIRIVNPFTSGLGLS